MCFVYSINLNEKKIRHILVVFIRFKSHYLFVNINLLYLFKFKKTNLSCIYINILKIYLFIVVMSSVSLYLNVKLPLNVFLCIKFEIILRF